MTICLSAEQVNEILDITQLKDATDDPLTSFKLLVGDDCHCIEGVVDAKGLPSGWA